MLQNNDHTTQSRDIYSVRSRQENKQQAADTHDQTPNTKNEKQVVAASNKHQSREANTKY